MNETAAIAADQGLVFQWIVGGAVVVLYARDRFRNPRPMRASTTFWRYWSAWCGYLGSMLMLFVVLGGGIIAVDAATLQALLGLDAKQATLPGPLLAALMLTSLLPHSPVLGKVDEAVKQWFQRVGNIPFEVRELSAHLATARYEPSPELLARLLPTMAELGVDPAWLREPADTLRHRWARSVALFANVQQWEGARGYSRYVNEHRAVLGELRGRMSTQAELLTAAALNELDRKTDSLLMAHLRKKLAADIVALQRAVCDVASGGVLNRGWNQGQRRMALQEMGLSPEGEVRGPLSSHDIVLVTGIVFLAMLFVPLTMRRFFDPEPLSINLRVLVMVPIIYALAIVLAVYPKSVWSFATRRPDGPRPFAAYAMSGALAAVAAFLVSLLFRYAFDSPGNLLQVLSTPGTFARAWHLTLERWPWLLMSFFATIAIAWAADDHLSTDRPAPAWLRPAEAAALAAVFMLLQWTVLQVFASILPPQRAAAMLDSLPRMLATSAVIGGAIGWYVPHLCRTHGSRRVAAAVPGPARLGPA